MARILGLNFAGVGYIINASPKGGVIRKEAELALAYYITVDGGGSKCLSILFDENMNIYGHSLTGGVNETQSAPAVVREHIADNVAELLCACCPPEIEAVFASFVGPFSIFQAEVEKRTHILRTVNQGEAAAGIYASGLRPQGYLAIAGTGSDVFYLEEHPEAGKRRGLGGWGPILGDQGSGAWLGQQALRAAVDGFEKTGEETMLGDLFVKRWDLKDLHGLVSRVHRSPAPFSVVASAVPVVGEAARAGDAVALRLIKEAGWQMAHQMLTLIRREDLPKREFMTVCGGAWKCHPLMFETFRETVLAECPEMDVQKPVFEHVCAGPIRILLEQGLPRERVKALMMEKLGQYALHWPEA